MSGSSNDSSRSEDFKRATAGALRAVAGSADVQVAFQPGPSGLAGRRAKLPLPTRALPAAEMARLRGAADSVALRLKHHDEAMHAARAPGRREAKDAYDALEQARVEVVGGERMDGVAANLRARLIDSVESEGWDRMTRREQMSPAAALSLLARERMTGEASPPGVSRVLDQWREVLGESADAALGELAAARDSQTAYTKAARKLLAAMDLAEAELDAEPELARGRRGRRRSGQRARERAGRRGAAGQPVRGCDEHRPRSGAVGRGRRRGRERRRRGCAIGRGRGAAGRPATAARAAGRRPAGDLPRVHPSVRRGSGGRGFMRRRRIVAPASAARPAVAASAGRRLEARQPPAAPADGAADPRVGVRSGRGDARRRPARADRRQPACSACRTSASGRWISATPW